VNYFLLCLIHIYNNIRGIQRLLTQFTITTNFEIYLIVEERQNRYTIAHFLAGCNDLIRSNVKKGTLVDPERSSCTVNR
jgi:hypothetical protein